MTQHVVSILVPNYKTLKLTQLCLRLLRKHTDLNQAKVIVIDNDSQDESLDYLRTVSWIDLIERKAIAGESVYHSHSRALDLALAEVTTPYVLSIHTDTLVRDSGWLDFLLSHIVNQPNVAGVGSWKLEQKPFLRRLAKRFEACLQRGYYQLTGKSDHRLAGVGDNFLYLRSHCALYRADLLHQFGLHFADGDGVAGRAIHEGLQGKGFDLKFLSSESLLRYMDHVNHATMVLNPALGTGKKNLTKGVKRVYKALDSFDAESILADASLDS